MSTRRLKYYSDEEAKYPALHNTTATLDECARYIHTKHKDLGLKPPAITFSECRYYSSYDSATNHYVFALSDMSWLTVIHEAAHAWQNYVHVTKKMAKRRPHDKVHAECVELLVAQGIEEFV